MDIQPVDKKEGEGWTWLINSKKWHYFRKGRSLCGKFLLFSMLADYETDNDGSEDNCSACKKKRIKDLDVETFKTIG